jgi:hypothetical protein
LSNRQQSSVNNFPNLPAKIVDDVCAPQQTTVRAVGRDGKQATLEVTPERRLPDVVLPDTP